MNKNKNTIFKIITIFLLVIFNINFTYAGKITVVEKQTETNLTWEDTFNYYGDIFNDYIPDSYKYIELEYTGINKDSETYDSLQKLVYLDFINNTNTNIYPSKELSAYAFYKVAEKIFDTQIVDDQNISELKDRKSTNHDITVIENLLNEEEYNDSNIGINSNEDDSHKIQVKKTIFKDVYSTILNNHYNKNDISEEDIITSAIEGLVDGVGDKHTVYFPPIESESFYESLNGEYEGIGAYVELTEPGIVKIVSPIKDSPSEKAGLKGGDIITKVDGVEVTKNNSLQEVVSWIKGPKGTIVILTIKRGDIEFDAKVTRDKIIIKDVETQKINSKTFYIEITSFGENVSSNFRKALEELKEETNIKKVIIDLRNNGGGYLGQVSDMLGYFILEGEKTAIVKYLDDVQIYKSHGYNLIDFNNYEIILLQNSGTASASEIMIGTLKDYYPDVVIIGEQSYGKGSVQTIKSYGDGSSLKYTIAKWFTGKSETGIDGVGITPDIIVEFDNELYKENEEDNQLNKAINY